VRNTFLTVFVALSAVWVWIVEALTPRSAVRLPKLVLAPEIGEPVVTVLPEQVAQM